MQLVENDPWARQWIILEAWASVLRVSFIIDFLLDQQAGDWRDDRHHDRMEVFIQVPAMDLIRNRRDRPDRIDGNEKIAVGRIESEDELV
jgi:hypothetical protein